MLKITTGTNGMYLADPMSIWVLHVGVGDNSMCADGFLMCPRGGSLAGATLWGLSLTVVPLQYTVWH